MAVSRCYSNHLSRHKIIFVTFEFLFCHSINYFIFKDSLSILSRVKLIGTFLPFTSFKLSRHLSFFHWWKAENNGRISSRRWYNRCTSGNTVAVNILHVLNYGAWLPSGNVHVWGPIRPEFFWMGTGLLPEWIHLCASSLSTQDNNY